MAEAELPRQIANDINHMKSDLEEIRDIVYPPEHKISKKLVKAVQESERSHREGKYRELSAEVMKHTPLRNYRLILCR